MATTKPPHVQTVLDDQVVVRLRPPHRPGQDRFERSDPSPRANVARRGIIARLAANRTTQFLLILPNQIIFWLVIVLGFVGVVDPQTNFATAITWYLWFCVVFVLMAVVGRAWCSMCPFGGFAEWIQRRTFFRRLHSAIGLGRPVPPWLAEYGFLGSVATFVLLTFIEEYFNIAGPGVPRYTAIMVLGIVATAVSVFLVFERRSFCRYLCPLSALIGTVGSMGSVAGFRTVDRETCLECTTKDCMRGGASGYGCPWFTWPGSAESNAACGLCTECYKACPSNNVGLFLQAPLTSVVAPKRRRWDLAWAIAILWGLVIFQQFNATDVYSSIDATLNRATGWPAYPNPIDYLGIIAAVALATAGIIWAWGRAFLDPAARRTVTAESRLDRVTPFRQVFLPLTYGLIPVVGMDYFARQLPKFFKHIPSLIPAIVGIFGVNTQHWSLLSDHLLAIPQIVEVQVGVMALGVVGGLWAMARIFDADLASIVRHRAVAKLSALALVVVFGAVAGWLYVIMHGAS
ncbi:cyclic nucleotide-binding protein [Acidimicrobium ferrooxidans DSM 10331]|uniref:Cyclic nucleotide-binding protein n=1 Tax=Acidimicrobium ferrooxidans (strain DSM 10331 / JCM 15462 / NBRC 103882 / ICP) TaxID=525909 RepID=C7M066_ACIFD|nr:4Fe-4S binding protein [Acidimicrobium ferrooxidans]ACU54374.1 cyclic nucleotide-binding protein [Acidimicrobium ferrooxidans DSM 10331]